MPGGFFVGIIAHMRKFLVVLILFLAGAFVILSFSELERTVETLRRGNLWYLLLSFLIQIGWFFLVGITYRSIYRLLGMRESILTLTRVAAAANFVNVVMPTVGVGGIAVFVNSAKKGEHPTGKVTLAAALFLLFDQAAFLGVLALGMVALFRRNDLNVTDVLAAVFLLAVAALLAATLYIGSRSVDAMGHFLARLAGLVNAVLRPFFRRDYLREERAYEFASEMADGLGALPHRPRSLLKPLLLAFLNKGLLISILLCAFLAFQVPYSPGTIIGGFAIGYLFMIVSPTPSGIGVVEGVLPLALKTLRVVWSQAVVITLVYRAMTFWVPLGVGALAFRSLHLDETKEDTP
jgi:glycosyltransferase 2 family protein